MRTRPLYYGWYDQRRKTLLVSRYPADSPVRPSIPFATVSEVMAMLERKRADIMWWPPLSRDQLKAS